MPLLAGIFALVIGGVAYLVSHQPLLPVKSMVIILLLMILMALGKPY